VCQRCQRTSKHCEYAYPPQLFAGDKVTKRKQQSPLLKAKLSVSPPVDLEVAVFQDEGLQAALFRNSLWQLERHLQDPSPQPWLGQLGKLQPLPMLGDKSGKRVLSQIREFPGMFALRAETPFIHKALYPNFSFPRHLRAAFGICGASAMINDHNRQLLFQALDAEMVELLSRAMTGTLLDQLTRLQAAVLYQVVRLFYGSLEDRIIAERQEFLVRSYALKLLHRADEELQQAPRQTWEEWILAESVRRTVIVAFKMYTTYADFQYGTCPELSAIKILPMSPKLGSWTSRERYLQYPERDELVNLGDSTWSWRLAATRELEPFEELVLAGCAKFEQYRSIVRPREVVE
jgi:hypothetical protein